MHFVTGGAFNGKTAWVKTYYDLSEQNCRLISGYREDPFPRSLPGDKPFLVLNGIEQYVYRWLHDTDEKSVRKKWQNILEECSELEKKQQLKVIIIGTDITKGIVPTDKKEREWRDAAGRVFQDTATVCRRVDIVWYGQNKTLKNEPEESF